MGYSVSLFERVLRALGVNPTQLRWRLHRLRERYSQRTREMENQSRALTYRHKVCPSCGLSLDASERRCSRCGEAVGGVTSRRLRMLWQMVIPEGTYTYSTVLVVACVAFYLAMVLRTGGTASLMSPPSPAVVIRFGAWTTAQLAHGEVWRWVTSMFLHFDVLHLIFNALWLIQLGPLVEQRFGRSRFLLVCVTSGVAGAALSGLYRLKVHPELAVGAGASSIVFGLIGVSLIAVYLRKSSSSDVLRGGLVRGALYAIIFSLLPGIDLVAHLGGALGGAACGAALAEPQAQRAWRSKRGWVMVELALLAIVAISFGLVVSRPMVR